MNNQLILIVEDDPDIANSLSEWLRLVGYQTLHAPTGRVALELLHRIVPAIIISDISMPEMDGYQFYETVRARPEWTTVPFLFLTARSERNDILAGKGLGADDYIIKPWSPDDLLIAIQAKIHRSEAVAFSQLQKAYKDSLIVLAAAIEARDAYTRGHVERVSIYAVVIGHEMGLDEHLLADLELGAILHDIGKIAVPESVLGKPDKLTELEALEMRKHPVTGAAMIKDVPYLAAALPTIRHHHERWDGSGYPDGLAGEAIPLNARILAVADTLDALITKRVYRPPSTIDYALNIIRTGSGKHFDQHVVEAFFRAIDKGWLAVGPNPNDIAIPSAEFKLPPKRL
jgi:putative two-component system response regulator